MGGVGGLQVHGICSRGSAIYFVWIERLKIEVNGSYVDVLLKRVVSVVLVLWGVGPVLRNGYEN